MCLIAKLRGSSDIKCLARSLAGCKGNESSVVPASHTMQIKASHRSVVRLHELVDVYYDAMTIGLAELFTKSWHFAKYVDCF